ncbi:MAG: ribonuclease III [Acidobacteria bacterium]|nr:ribonuclease III [Acidobacteriota bacterium]
MPDSKSSPALRVKKAGRSREGATRASQTRHPRTRSRKAKRARPLIETKPSPATTPQGGRTVAGRGSKGRRSRGRPAGQSPEQQFKKRLGYRFRSKELLETALTHSSSAHEQGHEIIESERMEFLGDAVLDFLIGEMIFLRVPNLAEGPMSRLRAALVQEATLAERARDLGLPEVIRLGKGERNSGGKDKASIQADIYESLLAAVYLDGGLEAVRSLVDREFVPLLESEIGRGPEGAIQDLPSRDPKTALQEWLQARGRGLPRYRSLETRGPAHARRFRVGVEVGGKEIAEGESTGKRAAESRAALAALRHLKSRSGRGRATKPVETKERRISSARAARKEVQQRGSRRGRAR